MAEDSEGKNDLTLSSRARRIHDWLMRPKTVRIVGPAALVLGLALVALGLLIVPSGGDDAPGPRLDAAGSTAVPASAYRVPPQISEAVSYRVPEAQPSAGFRLVIKALDVNAYVVRLGVDSRDVPQIPNNAANVAWYDFSAVPGTGSNAVLAGHVRWAGDPGVFADVDELEEGDIIRLLWQDGSESTYEVSRNFQVDANDPQSLMVMAPSTADIVTLITCSGTFVVDSDNPLGGDFTDRIVVQARLVEPSVAALAP